MLIAVCIVRFIFNLVFILAIQPTTEDSSLPCGIKRGMNNYDDYTHTIIYLSIGIIITHYFPVFLILKLYDFDTSVGKKKKEHESVSSYYS